MTDYIDYRMITWTTDDGKEHQAIIVSWAEVIITLGRAHDGSEDDNDAVVAALLASGAPRWVADADCPIEGIGWYLFQR